MTLSPALALVLIAVADAAVGHDLHTGFLLVTESRDGSHHVALSYPSGGERWTAGPEQVRFPADCETVDRGLGHGVGGANTTTWRVRCSTELAGRFVAVSGSAEGGLDLLVRVVQGGGEVTYHRLRPGDSGFTMAAGQTWPRVAATYGLLGIEHILLGVDHLFFVLALLLLTGYGWPLVLAVTAFTAAHSLTLATAALGYPSPPQAGVESVIALSIVFLAAEVAHKHIAAGRDGLTERYPWLVAFGFGLLHGFGFAGALAEQGLPNQAIPLALGSFNLGVELGQLAFIATVLAAYRVVQRVAGARMAHGLRLPVTYLVGSIAAFWLVERVSGIVA